MYRITISNEFGNVQENGKQVQVSVGDLHDSSKCLLLLAMYRTVVNSESGQYLLLLPMYRTAVTNKCLQCCHC